ncbi:MULTISPECIES: ZIP family metal transporter [Thermomonosporaceae]|uniref:ZIP family metal transporter n=1 Tax=Thermomonosporaceae TaxID=2012 RepID=UPI00255AD6B2|nr:MULTISPECIES: ZIP family metal transporter [Thermomonosporaceae]MDL4773727.1 ZIP family metal transporter [Actinomadura xylanilytica]
MAVLLSLLAFLMTLAGGLAAMRVHDHRHLVLGLAGGLMLGVVAFDLVPESLEMSGPGPLGVPAPMIGFACGFLLLHVVEQSVAIHRGHEGEYAPHVHAHGPAVPRPPAAGAQATGAQGAGAAKVGLLAACALVAHSFIDGLSIGLGFQSGTEVGAFVALAVVTHDFADGFNTFTAASLNRAGRRPALVLLFADALAPIAGAAATLLISVPRSVLGPYLGLFAGVLLYLAAAEILPEAHSDHPRILTLCATALGLVVVLLGVGLAD